MKPRSGKIPVNKSQGTTKDRKLAARKEEKLQKSKDNEPRATVKTAVSTGRKSGKNSSRQNPSSGGDSGGPRKWSNLPQQGYKLLLAIAAISLFFHLASGYELSRLGTDPNLFNLKKKNKKPVKIKIVQKPKKKKPKPKKPEEVPTYKFPFPSFLTIFTTLLSVSL